MGGYKINDMLRAFCLLVLLFFVFGCVPKITQAIPTSTYVLPTLTPTPKPTPVTATLSLLTPTPVLISPTPPWHDNSFIAYIKGSLDPAYQGDNALYVTDSNGRNQINVFTGLSGIRGDFSWSASGNWLLFDEYKKKPIQNDTNTSQPYNLWVARPDGTQRRKLLVTDGHNPVRWASNKDIFLINCDIGVGDLELCIVNPENGKIIKTGNNGTDPKFSFGGNKYAYIRNDKEIYVADVDRGLGHQIFSTTGLLHDFSWTSDGNAIITAVVNHQGCGNKSDGSSTIIKIDVTSGNVKLLREVTWSFYQVDLSPDQHYILSNWNLCVGNTYNLPGVIGLDNDLVVWPLENFTSYTWSYDGKYLLANYYFFGEMYFIDPITGHYVGEYKPPFLDSLLPKDNSYAIYWAAQPIVK